MQGPALLVLPGLMLVLINRWLHRLTNFGWVVLAVGAVLALGLWLMAWSLRVRLAAAAGVDDSRRTIYGEFAADPGVALTTGAIVGVVLLLATWILENDLTEREARREDVRFVREVATQPDVGTKAFDEMDLSRARLAGLDLSNAHMSGTVMVHAELDDADLHNADLTRADLSDAELDDADLHNADLTRADLSDAGLANADLSAVYLYRANLRDADLSGASLAGADLTGADLSGAQLQEADLSGADITDVSFQGADLRRADLPDAFVVARGADFRAANLRGADLDDTDLCEVVFDDETIWPDGFPPPGADLGEDCL